MAEYCDTLQSKEKRDWEYKACLNDRALRLLDHEFIKELCHSAAYGFKCNSCCTLHSPRLLIAALLKEQLTKEFILDS